MFIAEDTVFGKMINHILEIVEKNKNEFPNDSGRYKLSFLPFTINILLGIIRGIGSISLLITEIGTSDDTESVKASKSMYSEAFVRYNPELFRFLFYQLLLCLDFMAIPDIRHLGQFMLVDGSLFPAVSSMHWASYKSTANAIKLNLSFNLNKMIPVEFLVKEGNFSEKKFLSRIIQEGITYICDRGYISFAIFEEICEKGAFFIIRGKKNICYSVEDTLKVTIPFRFNAFVSCAQDMIVRFGGDKSNKLYRIVSFTAMGEEYIIITNRSDLTTYEIIMLYAYRWQVELCFRFLKRTLNGIHLMTHDPKGIQIQFYLYMIAYLLLLTFRQECETENAGNETAQNGNGCKESCGRSRNDAGRPYVCGLVSLIGKDLKKFWKIGIHWLTALRNSLLKRFDREIAINLSQFT
ncbi:MAG: IS4 family transposase [Bacteroidia bacterium]|nr:IS4 family transposase [Bacteroidia bacterium]